MTVNISYTLTTSSIQNYMVFKYAGVPCSTKMELHSCSKDNRTLYELYSRGRCESFSVAVTLDKTSSGYGRLGYTSINQITQEDLSILQSQANFDLSNLQTTMVITKTSFAVIGHVQNIPKVHLPGYRPIESRQTSDQHQTKFTLTKINPSKCFISSITVHIIYSRKNAKTAQYLSLHLSLKGKESASFYQDVRFKYRSVLLQPGIFDESHGNGSCKIQFKIEPQSLFKDYTDGSIIKRTSTGKVKEPDMYIYFPVKAIAISWLGATDLCKAADSHLPSLATSQEEEFLVHLMQKFLTYSGQKHPLTYRCKQTPLCYVFIGAHRKVSL